ncbi:MAG: DUF4845 domain-containing protein [Gallionellales bacterium RBG_16_56_9]|nr:MAG: DUF4845 domain-containing protein [Gallionellales bacterium RBG_16_56_9]
MNTAMPATQRGLSFFGFIMGAFVLVLASITGLKLIPAYMQNAQIKNVFVVIANDPEMQKAAPRAIRDSFSRRASIEDIKAIKAEDIEIASDAGKPVLSASYSVKIPLAGNVSLYLDFNPSSDK